MKVKESGWYSGYRHGDMKQDKYAQKFEIDDVFYDDIDAEEDAK